MASQQGSPSSATTASITAIGDDLLCEIFLRLPSLPSLVRAALTCRAFLHAVRSSPTFRRRFRALHGPQILGFFDGEYGRAGIPTLFPMDGRSDQDLTAAVHGSDFLFTRLPIDWVDNSVHGCRCRCGYVLLHNKNTNQIAAYNPLKRALHIFPYPPQEETCDPSRLEFRIIFSDEVQRSFRLVCVHWTLARFHVFSSDCMEWQSFSWAADTSTTPQPGDDGGFSKCLLSSYTDTSMDEFDRLAYWKDKNQGYMIVLNTATLQLSRMDLPLPLRDIDSTQFEIGRTNDGKLCMVCVHGLGAEETMLDVWFWRADHGDGVDKWMPHKVFPLNTLIDVITVYGGIVVRVVAVIDGFVFLCIDFGGLISKFFLSFCLETENAEFFNHSFRYNICPYIMAWPPSLISNKENLETNITGDDATDDDGPVGIEETPPDFINEDNIQTICVHSPLKITILVENRNIFYIYCS